MNTDVFAKRTAYTANVVGALKKSLRDQLGEREGELIGDHTCVYATGSCGRGEMGVGSDLDAYLVRLGDYLPFMLVNDIVRYWRIVLLNHESRLRKYERKLDSGMKSADRDARLLAERRYRSYKLRLPRCLTCFSALTPAGVNFVDSSARQQG